MECTSELQEFFTDAGYYANAFLREAARDIERLARPLPQEKEKQQVQIQCVVRALFAIPLACVLLLPSLACYTLAALTGRGRFKYIASKVDTCWQKGQSIKVLSLNACLQDPWSPLTGGVVTPFESVGPYKSRVAALVECIGKEAPHIFLGQEFEDLGAQKECVRLLRQKGFNHFVMDLGSDMPIRNSSGLFIASKIALHNLKFTPFPWEDRQGLARGSGQGALSFALGKEIDSPRLVNTHLNYGASEYQKVREAQLKKHVVPLLYQRDKPASAVLFGDLNFDTRAITPEKQIGLDLGGFLNALEGRITCTDAGKHTLLGKSKPEGRSCKDCEESIDGIIYHPEQVKIENMTIKPLKFGDLYISDHYAAIAEVHFSSPEFSIKGVSTSQSLSHL